MEPVKSLDNPNSGGGTPDQRRATPAAELASAQPQASAASPQQKRPTHPQGHRRKPVPCRFVGSKKGCRMGDTCPYWHESPTNNTVAKSQDAPPERGSTIAGIRPAASAATSGNGTALASRSFEKPAPQTQKDPRAFQITQVKRRFHPKEQHDESGATLTFGLAPTDPDFPFDMAELRCVLQVPQDYPSHGRPTLKVVNPDMPRGFQINVEKGFDQLVDSAVQNDRPVTLLGLMNGLDRNLERFLTAERAQTIKFVANVGSRSDHDGPAPTVDALSRQVEKTKPFTTSSKPIAGPRPVQFSPKDRSEAEKTRQSETRQLEARLGRVPLYQKSADGLSYVVPINPNKPDQIFSSLRAIKTVTLFVPILYPLEKSYVEIQSVGGAEARAIEIGFQKWVEEGAHATLMSQINYLAQNMHILANTPIPKDSESPEAEVESQIVADIVSAKADLPIKDLQIDDDRPHIKIIPRPPEWTVPDTGSDSDFTSSEGDYDDEEVSEDSDEGVRILRTSSTTQPARGVALSLPGLEIFGIELLEVQMLSVTVKCDRCKEFMDIKNIKAATDASAVSPVRVESCRKCANTMNIGFRPELMHATSHRVGYLDMEGCTAFDLLPSHFVPTCSECSTAFPTPGIVAVRGTSAVANCRECHRRMTFKVPEIRFLMVGPSGLSSHRIAPRKKARENLGIVAGQELPRRGRCAHYGKSYRWFRFSCCAKVFPCDKCHDAATDHPNEHANRMICGFCSREQVYRPEDCSMCRSVLVGKAGSGFWEGGHGTRDKVKMSRKDPRKYKRRGGTTPGGTKK